MYIYIIEPRAQEEYEKAIEWYMERSERAALKLIKIIDDTLSLICKQPFQSKNIYKNFHETSTKNYPFTIVYTIEEATKSVVIFSIFHHKRRPANKYKNP